MPDPQVITPIPSASPIAAAPTSNHAMAAFAQLLAQFKPEAAPVDPIAHIRALEDAYQNQWILGTSELAQLLKMTPKSLARHTSVRRYGFLCERAGRNGTELAWKIRKPKSKKKKS